MSIMLTTSVDRSKPLLIYDDRCFFCSLFASTARRLSRGWIDIVGHYSKEGINLKNKVFPSQFDPNTMFWLLNGKDAFGGRTALIPLTLEILRGFFANNRSGDNKWVAKTVCMNMELSCTDPLDLFTRIVGLVRNGKRLRLDYTRM